MLCFYKSPPQQPPCETRGRSRPPITAVSRVTASCLLTCVARAWVGLWRKAWVGLWRKPISLANDHPNPHDIIWKSPSVRVSVNRPPNQKTFFVFPNILTLAPFNFWLSKEAKSPLTLGGNVIPRALSSILEWLHLLQIIEGRVTLPTFSKGET